jgi:hypothetical protein
MREAGGARGALELRKKGFKNVMVIRGSMPAMINCGFKWIDRGKLKYRDASGKLHVIGK